MELLLFVIAAALLYGIQLLLCRLIWNRKLFVSADFSENRAVEGETVQLNIQLENRKVIPLITVKTNINVDRSLEFGEQSNLAVSDKNYRSEIFSLRGYERVLREIPIFCAKRGFFSIQEIELAGNDLFYSGQFYDQRKINGQICVLPAKAEVHQLLAASRKLIGETVVKTSDTEDPFTFRGIRPYQIQDSIRDINWKASAKTGELRVNIREFTQDREIALILDIQWDALLRPENLLEEGIRIAGSLADELIAHGIVTSLTANAGDILTKTECRIDGGADQAHSDSIQVALARLELPKSQDSSSIVRKLQELKEEMDHHPSRNVSWVLISTQTGQKVIEAWEELNGENGGGHWIIPAYSERDLPESVTQRSDVMFWEVPYGK